MKKLYIDMDGTLANFYEDCLCLEKMWEEGFFRNLKPYPNIVESVKLFKEKHPEVEIFIASSVIDTKYCAKEKSEWLDKYLPEIDLNHRFFPGVGISKATVVANINKDVYLLDDYNIGLKMFEDDGGQGIKFKNNINHKGKVGQLWDGAIISYDMNPKEFVRNMETIMELG